MGQLCACGRVIPPPRRVIFRISLFPFFHVLLAGFFCSVVFVFACCVFFDWLPFVLLFLPWLFERSKLTYLYFSYLLANPSTSRFLHVYSWFNFACPLAWPLLSRCFCPAWIYASSRLSSEEAIPVIHLYRPLPRWSLAVLQSGSCFLPATEGLRLTGDKEIPLRGVLWQGM